jgi:hypothetical protein
MAKQPEYNVCIKGEEFEPRKFRWHEIGAAWVGDNGAISIKLRLPVSFIVTPETDIRLFKNLPKENF